MLRFLNLWSILAAILFSLVVVIPFQVDGTPQTTQFRFEIKVKSAAAGNVQLFYDLGEGFSEANSQRLRIEENTETTLRFPLPSGEYKSLRFDPLDRETQMQVSEARIAGRDGRTERTIPLNQFKPTQQIASAEVVDNVLQIATTIPGKDPYLIIALPSPISLSDHSKLSRSLIWAAWVLLGVLLAFVAVGALFREPRSFAMLGQRVEQWALQKPASFIALVAFASLLASSYPVIFAGKSFVSANCGVALLYNALPPIPDVPEAVLSQPRGSDTAAMMWYFLPVSSTQHRAIFEHGELPLWDRFDSAGAPMLGQGISCFGDPLQWLPIIADGAAWAWDLRFLLAKWLLSFGLGLVIWRLTGHLPATILLTVSSQFIGFFIYRINHPAILSLSYAPWILYCWVRITQSRSWRESAWAAAGLILANWSELNSGTVKEGYMIIGGLNFSGLLLLLLTMTKPWTTRLRDLAIAGGAGVLFLLLSAPIWLTFLDTLSRSYTTYDAPRAFQIEPGMLAGLFDEIFYRPFQNEENVINPSANFLILLGLMWIVVRWRSLLAERSIVALVLSAVIPFALVFGVITKDMIVRIPLLRNILHIDNTFSCVLIILLSVLAGFGWREAWTRLTSSEGRKEAVAVLFLATGVVAVFVGTARALVRSAFAAASWASTIHISPFVQGYAWSLLLASVVGLFVLQFVLKQKKLSAASFLLLLLAFLTLHWRHGQSLGMGFENYHLMPGVRSDLHAKSPAIETLQSTRPLSFRTVGFDDDFLPGWSAMYNLEGLCGAEPLVNKYYRQMMECCEIDRVWDWRYKVYDSTLEKLKPAYDFLNIRYYIGNLSATSKTKALLKTVVEADTGIYESTSAWPRAFFTDRMVVYEHPLDLAHLIQTGDGKPFAAIHRVESERVKLGNHLSLNLGQRRVSAATDYKFTANTTSFTVNATSGGVIVLEEAYLKDDFRLTVNKRPADYFRVNHAFKGIWVDGPGTYHVTFSYWPRHFTLSLIAAGTGLLLLAISLVLVWRQKPRVDEEALA